MKSAMEFHETAPQFYESAPQFMKTAVQILLIIRRLTLLRHVVIMNRASEMSFPEL